MYKRQGKFGNAMECVERARACLEGQDSVHDKAELHQSKAMEKAQGASALIHQHGFKLEFASAKSRIDHLSSSAQARVQEYLAESESAHSRYDKYWIKRLQLFPFTYKANPWNEACSGWKPYYSTIQCPSFTQPISVYSPPWLTLYFFSAALFTAHAKEGCRMVFVSICKHTSSVFNFCELKQLSYRR